MSALQEKYRPKTLKDIIGQEKVVTSLYNMFMSDSDKPRSQCFLFVGPSGTGKTSTARVVGEILGTTKESMTYTELNVGAEGGIDALRSTIKLSQMRPMFGKTKVTCFDEVHTLSKPAWQDLLKPLEDIPPYLTWILCTSESPKIPDTISSRCTRFDFVPVKKNLVFDTLLFICENEKQNIKLEELETIAKLSRGSMRQAINLLDKAFNGYVYGEANIESMQSSDPLYKLGHLVINLRKPFDEWAPVIRELVDSQATGIKPRLLDFISKTMLNKSGIPTDNLLFALDAVEQLPLDTSMDLASALLLLYGRIKFIGK